MHRRELLVIWLLLPGCRQILGIPSDVTAEEEVVDARPGADGDGDAGAKDAGDSADAGACVTSSVAFDFADRAALEGWLVDVRPPGAGCRLIVENGQLAAYQTEPPATCTISRELGLDMVGDSFLQLSLVDPGSDQMNMGVRMVLSDGTGDIRQRRHLSIDRDDGSLRFGDCDDQGCSSHGMLAFDPSNHARWRFVHDSAAGAVYFEIAPSVGTFTRPAGVTPVEGIPADLVRCVGVEIGTYEATPTTNGTAAFDDLIGDLLEGPLGGEPR
jgi:hypothetical protein